MSQGEALPGVVTMATPQIVVQGFAPSTDSQVLPGTVTLSGDRMVTGKPA